ncbi:uncharacterized protein Tco025E_08901 [Trypanosoma conorhini]|uniref:Uncharacterized protein n=1 Tax=Trypanosoma conorhini TaxID=83891 RepID=A0A3R7M5Y7_9TRYP|nr:uncharacterized protein Tco025E_08901 [Trypanosoma conorhini]RNF00013.1 hypothetical protein Tco025E_08901 [Trypanosoma conorhini]
MRSPICLFPAAPPAGSAKNDGAICCLANLRIVRGPRVVAVRREAGRPPIDSHRFRQRHARGGGSGSFTDGLLHPSAAVPPARGKPVCQTPNHQSCAPKCCRPCDLPDGAGPEETMRPRPSRVNRSSLRGPVRAPIPAWRNAEAANQNVENEFKQKRLHSFTAKCVSKRTRNATCPSFNRFSGGVRFLRQRTADIPPSDPQNRTRIQFRVSAHSRRSCR